MAPQRVPPASARPKGDEIHAHMMMPEPLQKSNKYMRLYIPNSGNQQQTIIFSGPGDRSVLGVQAAPPRPKTRRKRWGYMNHEAISL